MTKNILILLTTLFVGLTSLSAQEKKTYKLYDKEGKSMKYSKMLKDLLEAKVVFFGEFHNDAIAHWLQLELANDLRSNHRRGFLLGAEMFEADDQLIIDEYLDGYITEKNFSKEAKLWPNYETDYRPLMELAKTFKFPFIATNVPRRYASMVYKKGLDSLSVLDSAALNYIAPLPIEYDSSVTCYKQMLHMGHGHANPNMPKAQAVKDATMAHFIAENLEPYSLMLHINGAYHSDNFEGIVWYLKKLIKPEDIRTISVVYQDDLEELKKSNYNKADYIFVINQNVTKTH